MTTDDVAGALLGNYLKGARNREEVPLLSVKPAFFAMVEAAFALSGLG